MDSLLWLQIVLLSMVQTTELYFKTFNFFNEFNRKVHQIKHIYIAWWDILFLEKWCKIYCMLHCCTVCTKLFLTLMLCKVQLIDFWPFELQVYSFLIIFKSDWYKISIYFDVMIIKSYLITTKICSFDILKTSKTQIYLLCYIFS